jgi:hypothetical protein
MNINKCTICHNSNNERGGGTKNYYLYYCNNCRQDTPYCFDCNKAIDFLLNSIFFKCKCCNSLTRVTKRETVYSRCDDTLFKSLFLKQEESMLLDPNHHAKIFNYGSNNRNMAGQGRRVELELNDLSNVKLAERNMSKGHGSDSTVRSMDRGKFTLITNYKVENNIEMASKLNEIVKSVRIDTYESRSKMKSNLGNIMENANTVVRQQGSQDTYSKDNNIHPIHDKRRIVLNKENNKSRSVLKSIYTPNKASIFAGYNKSESTKRQGTRTPSRTRSVERSPIKSRHDNLNTSMFNIDNNNAIV